MTDEIRLGDDDLSERLALIADEIEHDRPAYCTFAAEGGAAGIVWTPVGAIRPAKPEASYPLSRLGVDSFGSAPRYDDFTLISRVTGRLETSSAWCFARTYHDVSTVQEHLCANAVDAVPLAVLLNLVEIARDPKRPVVEPAQLMERAQRWIDALGRSRFDEVLPTERLGSYSPADVAARLKAVQ